ncbi:186_t:CDS:2, partial [Acaulospora colombiana]
ICDEDDCCDKITGDEDGRCVKATGDDVTVTGGDECFTNEAGDGDCCCAKEEDCCAKEEDCCAKVNGEENKLSVRMPDQRENCVDAEVLVSLLLSFIGVRDGNSDFVFILADGTPAIAAQKVPQEDRNVNSSSLSSLTISMMFHDTTKQTGTIYLVHI